MRGVAFLGVLVLSGCASTSMTGTTTAPAPDPILTTAQANEQDNPAKGTRTCTINQVDSSYSTVETNILFANVEKNGSIGLAVTEDTYPGTSAYFLVGGKRYSGDGDHYVTVPTEVMFSDPSVQYTYTDWPYRSDHSGEDKLVGFKAAYDQCVSFLHS